jgi:hydrogenase maturation protease
MLVYLVIGYGNPLRSDDGVGQAVVGRLRAAGFSSSLKLLAAHQLLPEHAELISRAERVIFIDAATGEPPGAIAVREITAVSDGSAGLIHDFTPQTLLAYAERLYGQAPQAHLITVNGYSFAHGDSLTAEITAVLPELLGQVSTIMNKE